MKERDATPRPYLMESTRHMGYSFYTAVADILDNSIAASCKTINISWPLDSQSLSILDDGDGMDNEKLFEAMFYGADPEAPRSPNDLGRFGLGMKVASLSQCRCLTVISKKDGVTSCYRWDLDYIKETQKWTVQELEEPEYCDCLQYETLSKQTKGTLVVWDKIDNLEGKTQVTPKLKAKKHAELGDHLSLVFHRFLHPTDSSKKITIKMNNFPLKAADPFMRDTRYKRSKVVGEETPIIDGYKFRVKSYVLPRFNELDPTYITTKHLSSKAYYDAQGLYIYRNRRLISYARWYALASKGELQKTARILVDIPTINDAEWGIDVKKSQAVIPPMFINEIKKLVNRTIEESEKPARHRARKEASGEHIGMWSRTTEDNITTYRINTDNPVISTFEKTLEPDQKKIFRAIIQSIANDMPVSRVYLDRCDGATLGKDNVELDSLNLIRDRLLEEGTSEDRLKDITMFSDNEDFLKELGEW